MTNSEKRWLKIHGLDWQKVQTERLWNDRAEVDYSVHLDALGVLTLPDDMPPEEGLIIHTAAALDLSLHGKLTGWVEVPVKVFERCLKEVVAVAARGKL